MRKEHVQERPRTYSTAEAKVVREAFEIATRSFDRRLSPVERKRLAQTILDLAAHGCLEPARLATRAIIRTL